MRNAFERGLGAQLKRLGVPFEYEPKDKRIPYRIEHEYWPDFYVAGKDIFLEGKGRLDRDSKQKMLAVKAQHPELDIRFIFYSAHKKITGTKQTHAEWATRHGFLWCDRDIPKEWFTE